MDTNGTGPTPVRSLTLAGPGWTGKTEKLWPRMNTNGHEWEKTDTGPLADARGAGWTGKTEKLWPRMNTNGHEWEKTDTGPLADARGAGMDRQDGKALATNEHEWTRMGEDGHGAAR